VERGGLADAAVDQVAAFRVVLAIEVGLNRDAQTGWQLRQDRLTADDDFP
jgi:hypothetical protein